jgi:hypothetical protein
MIKDNKIMANSMIRERMQKLQEIGFNFTVHKDKWMEHWHELKAYKEKHGHCQVPTNYVENPQLGRWVSEMGSSDAYCFSPHFSGKLYLTAVSLYFRFRSIPSATIDDCS